MQSTYLSHQAPCNHGRMGFAAALAWDHAVSELCKAGRQGLVKPITWLESLLMGPIKHASNGCQSQGVDMYSFIHDMRLPWRSRCGPVRTTTKPQLISKDELFLIKWRQVMCSKEVVGMPPHLSS